MILIKRWLLPCYNHSAPSLIKSLTFSKTPWIHEIFSIVTEILFFTTHTGLLLWRKINAVFFVHCNTVLSSLRKRRRVLKIAFPIKQGHLHLLNSTAVHPQKRGKTCNSHFILKEGFPLLFLILVFGQKEAESGFKIHCSFEPCVHILLLRHDRAIC